MVVSRHIGAMPFLWVRAEDEAGPMSVRASLERNSIRLLSCVSEAGASADRPSSGWLGHYSRDEKVRLSGMWNVRETDGRYDPKFLDVLEEWAGKTDPI